MDRQTIDQEKIGAFIAQTRKARSLTQAQLADRLGVTQKSVSRWETGRNMPDYALLPLLAEALDVNIAELLTGEAIETDMVPKEKVTRASGTLLAMIRQKKSTRWLVGAVLSVVLTLAARFGLYNLEFSVDVTSSADLENALAAYHYRPADAAQITGDVLERQAVGRHLFVLFAQNDHPGASTLALLEKGFFGKYRFLWADSRNYPFPFADTWRHGGKKYAIISSAMPLRGLSAYAIQGTDRPDQDAETTLFRETYRPASFLEIREIPEDVYLLPFSTKYYDADGNEIDEAALARMNDLAPEGDETAAGASTGTAETWFVYLLEAVLLLTGCAFLRYFLLGMQGR